MGARAIAADSKSTRDGMIAGTGISVERQASGRPKAGNAALRTDLPRLEVCERATISPPRAVS